MFIKEIVTRNPIRLGLAVFVSVVLFASIYLKFGHVVDATPLLCGTPLQIVSRDDKEISILRQQSIDALTELGFKRSAVPEWANSSIGIDANDSECFRSKSGLSFVFVMSGQNALTIKFRASVLKESEDIQRMEREYLGARLQLVKWWAHQ